MPSAFPVLNRLLLTLLAAMLVPGIGLAAEAEIDLTYCFIMEALRHAILDGNRVNYINSLDGQN